MKPLYIISAILIGISGLISLYLFANPVKETIAPHWAIPLVGLLCFLTILGAERGPKAKNPEKGFWAILLGIPVLAILIQLNYLAQTLSWLWPFESRLVPFFGLHIFLMLVGNYVVTSKSLMSGLPTPWNLRSDMSWRKSHRFIGYGTIAVGLVSAIYMGVNGQFNKYVLGCGLLGLWLVFVLYSWWVWRNDPDRRALYGMDV